MEERNLGRLGFEVLMGKPEWENISSHQGPIIKVNFRDNSPAGLYVNHEQKAESYFEVEVLELNGEV